MRNEMKKYLLGLLISLASCCPHYSEGERIGIITKISEKGFIFKSWQGEMLMIVTGTIQPEKFEFSVDPSVVSSVKEAMYKGIKVSLSYHQWLLNPPSIDTPYVVYKVKIEEGGR